MSGRGVTEAAAGRMVKEEGFGSVAEICCWLWMLLISGAAGVGRG